MKTIRNRNRFCLISAFILLSLTGCKKDFLDRSPEDTITASKYYQTDNEVYMATAPLYNVPWTAYNNKCGYALGDARAGNLKSNDRNNYYMFTVEPHYDEVRDAWAGLYTIIAQCNMTIYNINNYSGSGVTENAKKQAKAEARLMRGIAYSTLVMLWGPVPIIYDNVVQMNDTAIVPNTEASIWEFIIRDMRFAVSNLPEIPIAVGRLTKYAAEAFLGRTFLYHSGFGRTEGNRNLEELDSAKYYLKDVCENSRYELMDNYYDLFLWENDNNPESIFALQWETASSENWTGIKNQLQAFLAYEPEITGAGDGWGGSLGPSSDMVKYYLTDEPEDTVRRKATFMFKGDHYPDLNAENGGYDFDGEAAIKKYVIGRSDDNPEAVYMMGTGNNTYMMRLAEVYLLYAEAILGDQDSTADPEALYYFNAIRNRAGLDSVNSIRFGMDTIPRDTTTNQGKIFWEKRVELCMEGNTWYDMVRLYYFMPDKVIDFIGTIDKGENYTLETDTTIEITGLRLVPDPEYYQPNAITFWLPYPEIESAVAHNLSKTPVPFDFNLLKED